MTARTPLARRRMWTSSDFAEWCEGERTDAARRRARRLLLALDRRHGGKLLAGRATFPRRRLERLEPELFVEIDCIDWRVDALEEEIAAMRERGRGIVAQAEQNSRDVARIRGRR